MTADSIQAYNSARPPSPGDDASPFLLRVYVTRRPHWRHLSDFEHTRRTAHDEYKLYVWRSTTLRTLAHLLHSAQPNLSLAHTPHAFRLVYYNSHRSLWCSRDLGRDVRRVGTQDLLEKMGSEEARELLGPSLGLGAGVGKGQGSDANGSKDGSLKLGECGIVDGDIIECLISPAAPGSGGGFNTGAGAGAGHTHAPPRLAAGPVPRGGPGYQGFVDRGAGAGAGAGGGPRRREVSGSADGYAHPYARDRRGSDSHSRDFGRNGEAPRRHGW